MAEKNVLKNLTFVGATAADCCYLFYIRKR